MGYTWFGSLNMTDYVGGLLNSATKQLSDATQTQLKPMQAVQVSLSAKMSNYVQIDKLFSTLTSDIQALNAAFNPTPQINTSNPNIVNASQISGQTVTTGTHTLNVSTLAAGATYASVAQNSPTDAIGSTDTLTIQVGPSGTPFSVSVSATDSLQTISANIAQAAKNNNITGVTTQVVQSSSGHYQLIVGSAQTGTANAITVTDNSTGSPQALGVAQTQPASDAQFTYDGVPMTQSSNSNISIGGLNVNLLGTGLASLTVTSSSPVSTVVSATSTVVDDYNNVMTALSTAQVSVGSDSTLAGIQSMLQNLFQNNTFARGPTNDLFAAGISFQNNQDITPILVNLVNAQDSGATQTTSTNVTPSGLLVLDEDALTQALSGTSNNSAGQPFSYSAVQTLLTDPVSGIFTQVNSMLVGGGAAYSDLHDPNFGAEIQTQSQISDNQQKMASINSNYTQEKQSLKMQYASLLVMLEKMQVQSQALSSEIDGISNPK